MIRIASPLLLLLLASPLWAQDTISLNGNIYHLKKIEGGYELRALNGWTPGSAVSPADVELEVEGFTVRMSYTFTPNFYDGDRSRPRPPEEAADMVDVLEVPDGWIAWPAYQSVDEGGVAVIRIIPNSIS